MKNEMNGMLKIHKNVFEAIYLILTLLMIFLFSLSAAAAESEINSTAPLDEFMKASSGKYTAATESGTVVLELIPAFSRLFGAVGFYMEGSLYSYYAAEFVPMSWSIDGNNSFQYTSNSIDFNINFFSNMSNAGNYWDGISQQRLTLLSDNLLITNFEGNGDGLISKDMILMIRNEKAPTIFPYGKEMAEKLLEEDRMITTPEFLSGSFRASWNENGIDTEQQISLRQNGEMVLLRVTDDLKPSLLLKGGYVFAENDGASYKICCFLSSPSSGTMPYNSCATLRSSGDSLIIEASQDDINGLLTGASVQQVYKRQP